MAGCTSCESDKKPETPQIRRVLWIALIANLIMFVVEAIGSFTAHSVSLRADALDFLGDAANYSVTLFVLGLSLSIRAKASMTKGLVMGTFGIWVLGSAVYNFYHGHLPNYETMGILGVLALATNFGVAAMLYKYKDGDSNMQSVWLCTRNDAIGNIAVMLAAVGVRILGNNIPDLLVATLMAILGLRAAIHIVTLSKRELAEQKASLGATYS
jgi:Co/Zn/Cd efflux system component